MPNLSDANMQRNSNQPCERSHLDTGTELYLPRPDPEDCECDDHGIEIKKARYKQLANKEHRLRNELAKVNREMIDLTSLMLSTCNVDETMKSVYKTAYEKRDLPVAQYRPLMVAIDSPIQSPIRLATFGLTNVYKDPIRFRYSALESPTIRPAKKIALLKISENCSLWDQPFTGCSEYKDTISKMGMINMRNQQQYLKPLLPPRNFGDCNLPKSMQRTVQ